jgi:hypothetical protein
MIFASAFFLTLLLVISLMAISYEQPWRVLASVSSTGEQKGESPSPAFDRQEVKDLENNDLLNMASGGKEGNGSSYVNIRSVTYSSDGSYLNATLWLASFNKIPSREKVGYGVLIDADLNENTGYQGIDYKAEISWNRTAQNWTEVVNEFSSAKSERPLNKPLNVTNFYGEKQQEAYVTLDVNLNDILTPERYRLFFYAYASAAVDPSTSKIIGFPILDPVRWTYVPPPEFTITTDPTSIDLTAGDKKEILVQVNSNTAFQPEVSLSSKTKRSDINFGFVDNKLNLSSFGIATTQMNINSTEQTKSGRDKFSVVGTLRFPVQNFSVPVDFPTSVSKNMTNNIPVESKDIEKETTFLMNVKNPVGWDEQFRNLLSEWLTPVAGIILTITSIVAAILGWGISNRRSKRK